jgi:hypothetical protein
MTQGLSPSVRLPDDQQPSTPFDDIIVEMADEPKDNPNIDDRGNVIKIEHGDGSVSISLDGRPLEESQRIDNTDWFRNLVDEIGEGEQSRIAEDLLRGVQDDLDSRKEWIEDRAQGIKLLGLKIEIPGLSGAADGAPVEGMSKVRHPLLLEACLRFQANARSELLPVDGPAKIRNDDNNADLQEDQDANCLERDINHYLTSTAKEYYPDTDRMLLMVGFGGTGFKKGYFCPLRNRPVIESIDADDVIVNNAATDLSNAKRITHRVYMRASVVKRLQILGVYKDTDLSTPLAPKYDSAQLEQFAQQGVAANSSNPDDRDREIYECYCELDISGFEHKWKGKITGLEIPYRVTIDTSTKQILSIVRNYDEETKKLPEARRSFVKYTFVPGMGFYDIGLLHILGNTTNAITAAWRELLDAGMYANFPGFLMADTGARQNTNIFRVPPGGGALVKTGGMPINQAIMPLPYKEPSQALMNLVQSMSETGMRIGGTSEAQVGEGRADAPVGTTLAMIEQATKVMNSVHKRLHAAQAEEFQILVQLFKENPESFWQANRRPAKQWDEQTFLRAIENVDLVPQADPNTASHSQRIMKIMALKQLVASNPSMYDPIAVDVAALQAIGWSNPQQFLAPPSAQAKKPPELEQKDKELALKKQEADTKAAVAQAQIAKMQAETQMDLQGGLAPQQDPMAGADLQHRKEELELKQLELSLRAKQVGVDSENRAADRESRERIEYAKIIQDLILHPESENIEKRMVTPELREGLKGQG